MTDIKIKMLNSQASRLVKEYRDNIPQANKTAKDFFKYANKNDAQSQAMIAYYTQINEMKQVNVEQVFLALDSDAKKDSMLQKQMGLMARKLNQKYPKTLGKRLALAGNGSVVSNRIRPKRKLQKMFVLLDIGCKKVSEAFSSFIRSYK